MKARKRVFAAVAVIALVVLCVWWWWPAARPTPVEAAPSRVIAIAPNAVDEPTRPEPVIDSAAPDAGTTEAPTVLHIVVPGAAPLERAQAERQLGTFSTSRDCQLVDERCTLTLEPGSWSVSVEQRGAKTTPVQVQLVPGENTVTLQRAPTATVLVRVIDTMNAPVAGALVTLNAQSTDRQRLPFAMPDDRPRPSPLATDAKGEVSIVLPLKPTYLMGVEATGYQGDLRTVTATASTVLVTLKPSPMIRGRVVRRGGAPVHHFTVDETHFDDASGRFAVTADFFAIHFAGNPEVNVVRHQKLNFAAEGLAPRTIETVVREAGIDLGDVVLGDVVPLRGRVVERGTRLPLAGAVVRGVTGEPVTTKADGSFELTELDKKAERVLVKHATHSSAVVAVANVTELLVIELDRGVQLAGTTASSMYSVVFALNESSLEMATVENQSFRFPTLRPGKWTLLPSLFEPSEFIAGAPLELQADSIRQSLDPSAARWRTKKVAIELGPDGKTGVVLP